MKSSKTAATAQEAQRQPRRRVTDTREKTPTVWRRKLDKQQSLPEAFYHALCGLEAAFSAERNLKIHSVCTVLSIALGFYFKLDATTWILLIFAIGMVVTAELLNTAIERVVDIASNGEFSSLARDAKDIAAGGVLAASIAALTIGSIIFVPRLLTLF